jgi:hypothetical protein
VASHGAGIARPGTARSSGRLRRTAATAMVWALVSAGALAGAGTAPGDQVSTVTLAYTCRFPAGQQQVSAAIAATVPETGTAGEPIAPDEVSATVTLPPAALADLTALGATSVAGTARLTVTVTQNGESVNADWAGLALPATPIPADGEVTVTATGAVAPVTVVEPSDLTVVAGDLGLELVPTTADGSATDPAAVSVPCVLNPDQNATLATVAVPAPTTPPTSGPPSTKRPGVSPGGGIQIGRPPPDRTNNAAEPRAAADIPPECGAIPVPPRGRVGCAYITGYSNVKKLDASIRVEPALTNVGIARPVLQLPFLRADNPAELVGGRFPPMKGSFLVFGFMPIEATLELSQVGPINIHTDGLAVVPFTYSVTSSANVAARIYGVKVNGVPLDVGPSCQTATPIALVLTGGTPQYTDILKGGPLSGFAEIPPFTGCGVTEDLDPLLTGTVSGPGNFVKVTQGNVCVPADPRSPCPPLVPQVPPPGSH